MYSIVVFCSLLLGCLGRLYISDASGCGVIATLTLYAKPIPYAMMMLYYAGGVNDHCEKILHQLADKSWRPDLEVTRLSLCISISTRPLVFPLFGMGMGTRAIVFQSLGLLLSFCIGLMRTLISMEV